MSASLTDGVTATTCTTAAPLWLAGRRAIAESLTGENRADLLADVVIVRDVDDSVAIDVAEDSRHGAVDAQPFVANPTRSWPLTTPSSLKSPGRTSSWRVKVAMARVADGEA